jgi:hypothetical protein
MSGLMEFAFSALNAVLINKITKAKWGEYQKTATLTHISHINEEHLNHEEINNFFIELDISKCSQIKPKWVSANARRLKPLVQNPSDLYKIEVSYYFKPEDNMLNILFMYY